MPVSGYPLPADRTNTTPMDTNHPGDHDTLAVAVNELSEFMDETIAAPPGDVTTDDLNAAIDAAKTDLRDEFPVPGTTIAMTSGFLAIPGTLATHPSAPPSGTAYVYVLTDNTIWCMVSSGLKTQLGPPLISLSTLLATEAPVTNTTVADVLSVAVEANALYDVLIDFGYEADNNGTTGLQFSFTTPAGVAGGYRGEYVNSANTGITGSATMTHLRKTWAQTSIAGGLSIGVSASGRITGTLITSGTAGTFAWRVRLANSGTAGKIYGVTTASFSGARMTLTRVA